MEKTRDTDQAAGIRRIRQGDREYPERLREIPRPPKEIYVLGEMPEERTPTVAIIGARDCSEYGSYVASVLGAALGRSGVQVVSGMARGIDGIGQEAALDAGGKAYAVLGSGVDVCYPAKNRTLYDKLRERGGILSEYPPGTPPLPGYFPARNRIVSGLADAVVVVEAREKSGTLITVDMALEQGREVYVVPGRVTDPLSVGCNRLMKLGAGILLNTEDFLEELGEICARRFPSAGDPEAGGGRAKAGCGEEAGGADLSAGGGRPETGSGDSRVGSGTSDAGSGGSKIGSRELRTCGVITGTCSAAPDTGSKGQERLRKIGRPETGRAAEKKARGRRQEAGGGKTGPSEEIAAAALTGEQRRLLEGDPELAAVYGALDITADPVERIQQRLPKRYREGQINVSLIRLCMEGLAMQVSPGHFCVKPIAPCTFSE